MTKINLKELQTNLATFERSGQVYLDPNKLIAIRLDMRSGGSFVKGLDKPWDTAFSDAMEFAAETLTNEVSGTVASYVGSDEITLVLYHKEGRWNNDEIPFFGGRTDKILSITASIATLAFNQKWDTIAQEHADDASRYSTLASKRFKAQFDSRVFQPDGELSEQAALVIYSRLHDVKKTAYRCWHVTTSRTKCCRVNRLLNN